MKTKKTLLVIGCFAGGLTVGGLASSLFKQEGAEATKEAAPTERVVEKRNSAGVAKFLASVSRADALPRGFNDKRLEMKSRGMGPLRSRSVLTHHMEDLRAIELEQLIINRELKTDEEVALAYKYLALADPERAWQLCFEHSENLAHRLLSIRTIAGEWGQSNPRQMLDVINATVKTKRDGVVVRYHAYKGWIAQNPESFSEYYVEVANSQREGKASRKFVAEKMLQTWLVKDPDAAKKFVASRRSAEEREMLEGIVAEIEK